MARLGRKASKHLTAAIGSTLQKPAVSAFQAVALRFLEKSLEMLRAKGVIVVQGGDPLASGETQCLVVGRDSGHMPLSHRGRTDKDRDT